MGPSYLYIFICWISSNVRNPITPTVACLRIPMITLHIHSHHFRSYWFLPLLEAILSDLSVLLRLKNTVRRQYWPCGSSFLYNTHTKHIKVHPWTVFCHRQCFFPVASCPNMPPHARVTNLVCDIDLLVVRHTTLPKHCWLSWSIYFGVCTLLAESNHLLLQKAIIYYLGCAHYWQKLCIF